MTQRERRMAMLCGPPAVVGTAGLVHCLFAGAYVVGDRTFWIGPISTTIPFVLLALAFWAHAARITRSKPLGVAAMPAAAYCGAAVAAGSMLALTLWVISQTPGPEHSSTMAIAVLLTPLLYLALLPIGYAAGMIAWIVWSRSRSGERES